MLITMNWPSLLVFVRHAESEGNIISGDERARLAIPNHSYVLTERGKQQSAITGEYLKKRFGEFDAYYQSYYARTKQTLQIMYPDAVTFEDARLAERGGGIMQTMTKAELTARFPEEDARKKKEGLYSFRPLGGENWPDVELRIHSFLSSLMRDHAGKKVLCVVHGHWLVLFQRVMHHFSIETATDRFLHGEFGNASVTIYEGKQAGDNSKLELVEENIIPWEGKIDMKGEKTELA